MPKVWLKINVTYPHESDVQNSCLIVGKMITEAITLTFFVSLHEDFVSEFLGKSVNPHFQACTGIFVI